MFDSTESTVNQSQQLAMQTASQWASRLIEEGKGEELQHILRATQTCKMLPQDVRAMISQLSQTEVNSLMDRIARESAIKQLDNEQLSNNNLKKDLDLLTLTFHSYSRQEENGEQAHLHQLAARLIKVQQLSATAFITFLASIDARSTVIEAFKYYSGQMMQLSNRYINCEGNVLTQKDKALTREKLMKQGWKKQGRAAEREQEQSLSIGEWNKRKQREMQQRMEQEKKEKKRQNKLKIKQDASISRQVDKEHDQKEKKKKKINKKKINNKSKEAKQRERVNRESINKVKVVAQKTARSQEHEKPVRRNSVSHK